MTSKQSFQLAWGCARGQCNGGGGLESLFEFQYPYGIGHILPFDWDPRPQTKRVLSVSPMCFSASCPIDALHGHAPSSPFP